MLLSALQVHGRHEEIHQHTIGHNLPWDGQAAEQPDRLYNRFAENWENKSTLPTYFSLFAVICDF